MTTQLCKTADYTLTVNPSARNSAILSLVICLALAISDVALAGQNIVALVNDEPISAYDVQQRTKLKLAGDRRISQLLRKKLKDPSTPERFKKFVTKAKPTSKEEVDKLKTRFVKKLRSEVVRSLQSNYKKEVLDELIGERLMLQDAKKLNLVVTEDEVNSRLQQLASRNKDKAGKPLTLKQFESQLTRAGIRVKDFRKRLKANLSLQKVVFRKYGRQIRVGEQQVDEVLASGAGKDGKKSLEFQLQKIKMSLPKGADQAALAKRLLEAGQLRANFSSCKKTPQLVKKFPNTVMQSLGKRTPTQISQPARTFVLKAETGEMTPPFVNAGSVELYAVCNKRVILADQKKRRTIQAKLRSEELQRLRNRYMRDLKQDAFIEYR